MISKSQLVLTISTISYLYIIYVFILRPFCFDNNDLEEKLLLIASIIMFLIIAIFYSLKK